jgi:hypothetical protein
VLRALKVHKVKARQFIPGLHHKLPGDAQDEVKAIYARAQASRQQLNLYIKGEGGDEEEAQ